MCCAVTVVSARFQDAKNTDSGMAAVFANSHVAKDADGVVPAVSADLEVAGYMHFGAAVASVDVLAAQSGGCVLIEVAADLQRDKDFGIAVALVNFQAAEPADRALIAMFADLRMGMDPGIVLGLENFEAVATFGQGSRCSGQLRALSFRRLCHD